MQLLIRRLSRIAAVAAVATLMALPLTPVFASPPGSMLSNGIFEAPNSCKPNDNQGNGTTPDHQCPPPVVPEAPLAVLVPLTGAIVVVGAYALMSRRQRTGMKT
jgi:hypothetical protein